MGTLLYGLVELTPGRKFWYHRSSIRLSLLHSPKRRGPEASGDRNAPSNDEGAHYTVLYKRVNYDGLGQKTNPVILHAQP